MKRLWLLLILFLSNPLHGGTIANSSADKIHIEYAEKFEHVVPINVIGNNDVLMVGSAVILNKNWIVTAAHIVSETKRGHILYNKKKYCLDLVICHTEFDDDKIGTADIALGYSSKAIDVPFSLELYKDKDELNKSCAVVGYGMTGTFLSGAVIGDYKKRAGANIIKNIHLNMLMCYCDPKTRIPMELLIASGDSGGGLFIDGKLAGVHSCVMAADKQPNSDYGDESGHTRVSDYADWIEKNIKSDDPLKDYDEQYISYSNPPE